MVLAPSGAASIVDSQVLSSGSSALTDHALNTNAASTSITGGVSRLTRPVSSSQAAEADSKTEKKITGLTKETQIQKGKAIYWMTCFACHLSDGQGIPDRVPPLAKSDFVLTRTKDSIRTVLMGCSGDITVSGKTYKSAMLPLYHLADEHIANVLTYVRNSWGNFGDAVAAEEVAKIRQEVAPPPTRRRE